MKKEKKKKDGKTFSPTPDRTSGNGVWTVGGRRGKKRGGQDRIDPRDRACGSKEEAGGFSLRAEVSKYPIPN